jgi:hypothetical protein
MANGHGGRRPNQHGRPVGSKNAETITKEEHREAHRTVIAKYAQRMIQSQVAAAIGIGHVFTRDKAGKFTRIEDEQHAEKLLTQGTEGQDYWIFMKDPSTAAFSDLMNRAFDRPKEQAQELVVTGELTLVNPRLTAARKRLAANR